jgi:drug/metabolite transporter (DMT)-like permease
MGTVARTGLVPLLAFAMFTATLDVYAGNVTTAVTWLSMLYALKFLEPAVVNVISLAIGPALTVLLGTFLRRGSSVLRGEIAAAIGICGLLVVLVWASLAGHSGVGERPATEIVLGIVLTLVCGLASTGNVIFSKRLSDAGSSPRSVPATRFGPMLVIGWVFVALDDAPRLGEAFVPSAVIAVIGVALPMYLFQVGVRHTEPITASLITTLSPVFALLLQLPDPRLRPSAISLASIVAITAVVAAGVFVRARVTRRRSPDPALTPPG